MGKFYLYTAILFSFCCAGAALAAKGSLPFFSAKSPGKEVSLQENIRVMDCDAISLTVTTNKHQTSCKNPNGKLTVSIRPSNGAYTIEWYESTGLFDPDALVGTGKFADKLVAGSYIVVVKDNANDCFVTAQGTVNDETPEIIQDVTVINDVIGCSGEDYGRLRINIISDGNSNNLTTVWMADSVVNFDNEIPRWKNMLVADYLPAGIYTIVTRNNNTGCYSDPFTIEIGQITPPEITGTLTPNTFCAGGNGTISVEITTTPGPPPAGGYTISWHEGTDDTGAQIGSASGVTAHQISDLAPGFYTVVATDPSGDASCITTETYEILDNPVYPTISLEATPNSVCVPNDVNNGYDGSITAQASENGAAITDFTDYTFNWFDADGNELPANPSGTANLYEGLPNGNYLVSVTNTITGCSSGLMPITVPITRPTLSLDLSASAQTFCSTPNGSISASASTTGTQGYTLQWFRGSSEAGTPLPAGNINGDEAINLNGDQDYFVKLVDNYSGCFVARTVYVPLNQVTPLLSAETDPNTICNPTLTSPAVDYNGQIRVSVSNASPGDTYIFEWKRADDSPITVSDPNDSTLRHLPEGQYKIIARHTITGCVSSELLVEVENAKTYPSVAITTTDQTACESPFTGTATTLVNGSADPVGYSYEWFVGSTPDPANTIGQTTYQATGLDEGTYTVRVTNDTTGCQSTAAATIQTVITEPEVSVAKQDIGCGLPGELTASVVIPVGTDYTITWYSGSEVDGANEITQEQDVTTSTLDTLNGVPLPPGYYTVVVTNNLTRCSSEPVTAYLVPPPPAFDVQFLPIANPNGCELDGGVVTAYVLDGDGNYESSSYEFTWYEGSPVDPAASFYTDPIVSFQGPPLVVDPNNDAGNPTINGHTQNVDYFAETAEARGQTLYNRTSDVYTVVVEDPATGCKEWKSVTIPYEAQHEGTMDVIDADECNGTGSIIAEVKKTDASGNPVVIDQTQYTFYLYEGSNPGGTPIAGTPLTGQEPTTTISGLQPGWYTLVAVENSNDCKSIAVTKEVRQLSLEPVASISNKVTNSSCATPNGSFDITVGPRAGDEETSAFLITITGPTPSSGTYSQGTHSITGLEEGNYSILVKGIKSDGTTLTNCETPLTTTLGRNTPLPVLSASATNQDQCSPANGTARVTQISFNGTTYSTSAELSEFTFAWYASEAEYNAGRVMADETDFEITAQSAGTYYVTASKNTGLSAGCPSAPAIVQIENVSTLPVIRFSSTPNGECNAPNGTLTATVTTAGVNTNDYTFKWFVGESTALEDTIPSAQITQDLSGNREDVSALEEGIYTLWVKEGDCPAVVQTFTVGNGTHEPNIASWSTPEPNTNCPDGNTIGYNGSLQVERVEYNALSFSGTADIDANFSFTLYTEDPVANPAAAGDPLSSSNITGLAPGTYYLVATKTTEPGVGCGQLPFVFTIEDAPIYPVFSIFNGTPSSACPGGTPNGSLEARIHLNDGSVPAASDYSIQWFQLAADGTENELATAVSSATFSSPDSLQVFGLPAGTYKAVATLNGIGCPVNSTFSIGRESFAFALDYTTKPQTGCLNNAAISLTELRMNGTIRPWDEFTYNWSKIEEDGSLTPILTNSPTTELNAIEAGRYRVEAVKKANPAGGCGPSVEIRVPLTNGQPQITVNQVRPVSGCNPNSKGLIDITVSSPLGNNLQVSWYRYTSYEENNRVYEVYEPEPTQEYSSGDQVLVEGLDSAYYRVEVYDPLTQCPAISRDFHIDRHSILPLMSASGQDAWTCSPPNGEIYIFMVNEEEYRQYYPENQFNVTVTKQEDQSESFGLIDLAVGDTLRFYGLGAGTYLVSFEENEVNGALLSGCGPILSDTVVIQDISVPFQPAIAQGGSYTFCNPSLSDVSLSASVSGSTSGYTFAWYEGEVDLATTEVPFSQEASTSGLRDTTYTVIVTQTSTGCKELATHHITNESVLPVPAIEQDVLLTKCDPALANAELIARVEGVTSEYTFEWFVGEADLSTPAGEAFTNQARATGLRDTTYTLRVTRTRTGCQGMASHTIEVDYPVVPVDSSWILSTPSTSCLEPDGSLEVAVDSLYTSYRFHWYSGAEAHPDSLIASDVYRLDSLSPGTYAVTITSLENGCTSTVLTKEVKEDYYFPKYQVKIKPSTCTEEGSARIIDIEGKIPFYEWYYEDKAEVIATNGPFHGPAGNYWLKIVSDLGCIRWVPVEINSVVDPYNAVSINGDGQNDYFHIDCIEMFPENKVKIFNRAGALVYETSGYDNSLNVFGGIGNRGIYMNGKELPVGTYFYVVDKNYKNEKPQTGFLELLR